MNPYVLLFDIALLAGSGSPSSAATVIEKSAVANRGAHLEITMSTGGDLTLRGHEDNSVTVASRATGPGAEHATLSLQGAGDLITVTSGFAGGATSPPHVSVTVLLPRNLRTTIHSAGGRIVVESVIGSLSGTTMAGTIQVAHTRGHLHLETLAGAIEVADSEVDGIVRTAAGAVVLTNVPGGLQAISAGGRVTSTNARTSSPSNSGAPVIIRVDAGPVKLRDAPNGADVRTFAGDVEIMRSGGPVKIWTAAGDIRLHEIGAGVEADTSAGNVWVTLVTGRAGVRQDVKISSENGDVHLKVPPDWGLTIEGELSYTREYAGRPRIHSPWPLKTTPSLEWSAGSGPPMKHERASGLVGSGEHNVRVSATNGEIFLEKSE